MASSSASASTSQFPWWNYKVFLSFKGEDTRKTFIGHLFKGLENSGIFTFQDDKRLEHGTSISDELLKAIEQSQVALVVFSKNYATSRWCLDELVKIMECKDQCGQTVMPVFYDVDPSHVRNQRESFAEAFNKHETNYKDDDEGMEKLQRWRNALTAAADLKGYDIRDGIEAENIQQIVDQISKLCNSANLSSLREVVGIDTHLEKLKSLLKIQMHDLIQEMGKYIVNLPKNPGERSRLWLVKDFKEVMSNSTGTMAMEAIFLPYLNSGTSRFSKNMKRLRIFNIERSLNCDGSIKYLPNSLRWFVWENFPWKSLPSTFEPKMLVHLELWGSSLHYLWMETKHLPSLRRIDLSSSRRLRRTPDFTGMPNLEYLNMLYCRNLEEVHHSLRCCSKLIRLNLNNCKSLKRFPCVNVESLEYLSLEYCSSLEKFPEIHGRMKPEIQIHMQGSGIRELPSSITQYQTHITKLDLRGMEKLVALPSSICRLKSLVSLSVSGCFKLESLPEEVGDLENLEELDASCTLISRPPSSIIRLSKLKIFDFGSSKDRVHFELPPVAEGFRSLETLSLRNCNLIDGGLPEDMGSLSSLKKLYLSGNNFEHLPRSIAQLGALRILELRNCKRLTQLPEFTGMLNLEYLDLEGCSYLEEVHHSLGCCKKLIRLNLSFCSSLIRFPCVNMESLKYLSVGECSRLEKFPDIHGRMKPEIQIHMKRSGIRELPSSISQYQTHITELDLRRMDNLDSRGY